MPKKAPIPWRKLYQHEIDKRGEAGLYLLGIRRREGMSQRQVAEKLGISRAQVSRMELGHIPIEEDVALALGEILNANPSLFAPITQPLVLI